MKISGITNEYNISVSVIRGDSSGIFVTKAAFGTSEGLYVEPFMHGDSIINFAIPGVSLDVSAVLEDEYPYFWRNVRIEKREHDGKTYHLIKADGDGIKLNRRNAFRVFVGIPGTVCKVPDLSGNIVDIKDISATGIAFIVDKSDEELWRKGDMISVKYNDEALRTKIDVSARIVRTVELENGRVLYGASYSKLYPQVERYVASKQLKNRARKKTPLRRG